MPTALRVIGAVLRIGQGPVLFLAPAIFPHHKDAHRLLLLYSIVDPLEPVIEPAKLNLRKHVTGLARCAIVPLWKAQHEVAMRPRTDHQALLLTSTGTASPLPHALVMLQVFFLKEIVPASDGEGGHRDTLIELLRNKRT